MTVLDLYKKEYLEKQFERTDLFCKIQKKYKIEKALYPGSYVHITPSFVIPYVVYVDSDKNAKRFFDDPNTIANFLEKNKKYKETPSFRFIHKDYSKKLDLAEEQFDLLVSQWAGPISQSCKKYLKLGGILLANNSHADSGLAHLDPNYKLVAVVQFKNGKFNVSEKNLEAYFIPKKDQIITIDSLMLSGKGIGYTKTANSYIFEKLK